MVGCQRSHFDTSHHVYPHAFLKSLQQISSKSPPQIYAPYDKSWKHQDFEYVGFEFPTCDSNYCIFPQGGHAS